LIAGPGQSGEGVVENLSARLTALEAEEARVKAKLRITEKEEAIR